MKDKALAGIAEINKRVKENEKDWLAFANSDETRLNVAEVEVFSQPELESYVRLTRSVLMVSEFDFS